MAKKNINWNKIKTEYITTDISQRKIAEKYDVPYPTIRDRCKTEDWYKQKKEHRSKIVAKASLKIGETQTEFLVKEYEVAQKFTELIQNNLNNENFVFRGLLDTKRVNEAAAALLKLVEVKRTCSGQLTEKEKQNYELQKRKLEIEEARAQKDINTDTKIVVEMSDKEIEEYLV